MNRLLQTWVTQQAETRPDATAIVMGSDALTFGQLETSSNRLAHVLQQAGCRRGDRVCIVMPKSPSAIVSMIGMSELMHQGQAIVDRIGKPVEVKVGLNMTISGSKDVAKEPPPPPPHAPMPAGEPPA